MRWSCDFVLFKDEFELLLLLDLNVDFVAVETQFKIINKICESNCVTLKCRKLCYFQCTLFCSSNEKQLKGKNKLLKVKIQKVYSNLPLIANSTLELNEYPHSIKINNIVFCQFKVDALNRFTVLLPSFLALNHHQLLLV